MDARDRLESLRYLVGNTPLLAIRMRFRGSERTIYAKQESLNFTGSIKDRMALHILEDAVLSGALQPGMEITEATSGNTGISFAALGRALGHPVRIYMPDWMSRERVLVIRSLGATIVPVSQAEGGFKGSLEMAASYAASKDGVFQPLQFDNQANCRAHEKTTGPEIHEQLRLIGKRLTGFVAGVGTGGTVMGVGRYLKQRVGKVAVHPLEPANSPTLRTGNKVGKHRIQGISDEFIPSIVDLAFLDSVVDAWDGDSILMAQKLARDLGLAVGISSGANLLGAIQVSDEQGPDAVVATVFADSNKKYLSTDLCAVEPPRDDYLTPEVELIGFDVIPPRPVRA